MTLPSSKHLFRAAWIAPMDGPILRASGLVIEHGRILATGEFRRLRAEHPDAAVSDLGNVVLLPGLVNAHAHLELSTIARPPIPASFVDWIRTIVAQSGQNANDASSITKVAIAMDEGINQCLRFGITSVGDITASRFPGAFRQALGGMVGPRLVSYGEVTAMAQRRGQLEQRIADATSTTGSGPRVRIGISPHAPYSIEAHGYRRCLEIARSGNLPLATHLAETRDEAEFLASHTGPFRQLWDSLSAWDDQVPTFTGGPIRFAHSLGLLDYPSLLAHMNYCDNDELAILAAGRASVVYCPRTHRYFGHPPHRFRDMLARGINVALGTDSCASSPDLNLLDDLRLVHQIAPDFPIDELWEMITIRPARAIGAEDSVGSLTPGKFADFVAFPLKTDDPLRETLESEQIPTGIWIAGERVEGRGQEM